MTPLQTAAQAVVTRWDRNEYTNAYLGVHITTLRKALEAEQVQEPYLLEALQRLYKDLPYVNHANGGKQAKEAIAKALEAEQAQSEEPAGVVDEGDDGLFVDLETSKGVVVKRGDKLFTRPAPPLTRPAPPLTEALAAHGVKLRTEFEPKKAQQVAVLPTVISEWLDGVCVTLICDDRSALPNGRHELFTHPAPPPAGERAELIARLQEAQVMMDYDPIEAHAAMGAAIDMLEADAQEICTLKDSTNFYKRRVELLQKWQSKMRDPERTIACDIIANGQTLPPENAGARYKVPVDAQQVAVPAGYALVPIEPTPEMCAEGLEDEGVTIKDGKRYAYALYRAMLAAAPQGDKA